MIIPTTHEERSCQKDNIGLPFEVRNYFMINIKSCEGIDSPLKRSFTVLKVTLTLIEGEN